MTKPEDERLGASRASPAEETPPRGSARRSPSSQPLLAARSFPGPEVALRGTRAALPGVCAALPCVYHPVRGVYAGVAWNTSCVVRSACAFSGVYRRVRANVNCTHAHANSTHAHANSTRQNSDSTPGHARSRCLEPVLRCLECALRCPECIVAFVRT